VNKSPAVEKTTILHLRLKIISTKFVALCVVDIMSIKMYLDRKLCQLS